MTNLFLSLYTCKVNTVSNQHQIYLSVCAQRYESGFSHTRQASRINEKNKVKYCPPLLRDCDWHKGFVRYLQTGD